MNRNIASTLALSTTAAAAIALAALASSNAYANGEIGNDNTTFVSTRDRAEVQAEVMGQAEVLRRANSEWGTQLNASLPQTSYTREQVKAEYIAARRQVNSMNGEDSGSSHIATLPHRAPNGVILAGTDR
ncbi:MAG TPA: hypothetical protein VN649_13150 [Ramlibacter sp.]|nr:hypothetical protein [Ramlibacter sp.]